MEPLFQEFLDANSWLTDAVYGVSLGRWMLALLVLLLAVGLRGLVLRWVVRVLERFVARTETKYDDLVVEALNPPIGWFLLAAGAFLALRVLGLPEETAATVGRWYRVVMVLLVSWTAFRFVDLLSGYFGKTREGQGERGLAGLVRLASRVMRAAIFGMAAVFVMQTLGFNVAGLLTGLGVGGLAFALAAQDTLGNWFGAAMIYSDRPFEVGDWIKTPSLEGTVEDVGLRSTRVRTFAKTLVTVPNRELAASVIENFSRMPVRRVSFLLGVTYQTSPSMMRETLARVRDLLRQHADVDQTFWLVRFTEFGDSALNIMVYYFTTTTQWDAHLAVREDINLQILEKLGEIGVSVAFPSRSIYLEQTSADELERLDAQAALLWQQRSSRSRPEGDAQAPADG